jgi:predicted nucleic acid-binding protein
MAPSVVCNTGPILALAHIHQHNLLRHLFGTIVIPPAVRAEIHDEISVAAVNTAEWISVQAVQDALAVQLLREDLDAGECEAIVLAKELSADLVLIDERAATRRARAVGLTVMGTLGVLLLGKQTGHIPAIKPLMDQLRSLDFHISTDPYGHVLAAAGETA